MKLIKDNSGMLFGETCLIPVCSMCGCRKLYHQETGKMYRLKKCPECGHMIDWETNYIVKKGDCLFTIAKKYCDSYKLFSMIEAIMNANNLTDIHHICPGMRLIIPKL